MKTITFLMATLSLSLSLMAQNRVPILVDDINWESEPPQTLEELISRSATAAIVHIDGRRTELGASGLVVVSYTATVDQALHLAEESLTLGGGVQFQELGGAFNNGRWIRQGFMREYANLRVGGTYLVFLGPGSNSERTITRGKYGAFEILSGIVLPLCDSDQPLYKELVGLRVQDLVGRSEEQSVPNPALGGLKGVR